MAGANERAQGSLSSSDSYEKIDAVECTESGMMNDGNEFGDQTIREAGKLDETDKAEKSTVSEAEKLKEIKKMDELKKREENELKMTEGERETLRGKALKLKVQGNNKFHDSFWQEAVQLYSEALDICPLTYVADRAVYLNNRAAAHIKLADWECAIEDCTEVLTSEKTTTPNEKALERRAYGYSQIEDKMEKAVEDYELLLKINPQKRFCAERIRWLKERINERNEKLKEDMISKLKDLGNICLKPFGLSTDNFQMTPQPGGGYSINMKK